MYDGFSFGRNAMMARNEIDDALSVFRGAQMPAVRPQMAPMQPQMAPMQPQMAPMRPQMPQMGAQMGQMGAMRPPMAPPMGGLARFKQGGHVDAEKYASGGGAWTRKEGKNPEGGLNAKGRASLRAQGHDIKPPVSAKQAKKSPKAAARRKSFCARMSGMPGPMQDESGEPTRKALALRKWDCKAEGGAVKPIWEKDRPEDLGKPKSLSAKKKAFAKRRAKAAGRPYPNLVDNLAAARKKGK